MRAAVRLSVHHAGLPMPRAAEIEDFLAGIPVPAFKVNAAALLAAASKDKKARRGRLRFVLLKSVGSAAIVDGVTSADVLKAIGSL